MADVVTASSEDRHPRTGPVAPGAPRSLFGYLLGRWELSRHLTDARLGLEGRFEGVARFEPDGACSAAYREEGVLTWPGHVGPAFRTLACASVADQRVAFSFSDGRPFHLLELRPEGFEAEHRCGDDRYTGRFRLLGDDAWQAVWEVTGPRKDLVLDGTYHRIGNRLGACPEDPGTV